MFFCKKVPEIWKITGEGSKKGNIKGKSQIWIFWLKFVKIYEI